MAIQSMTTDTTNVEDALAAWEVLCPGAITGKIDPARYRFTSQAHTFTGGGTITYTLTGATTIEAQLNDELTVADFAGRGITGAIGRDELNFDAPVLYPFDPIDMQWQVASVNAITIDMAFATRYFRALTRDDNAQVLILGYSPKNPALRDYWRATVRNSQAILHHLSGQDAPLIEAEVRRSLLIATLLAFPTNLDPSAGQAESRTMPLVARAKAFMDAHAHEPLSMPDIAQHLRCSLRTLQEAFARDDLGAPSAYLRTVRLNNARAELLASDPATTTVAEVARAWGFASPSRFTMHYTQMFGHTPRADLAA